MRTVIIADDEPITRMDLAEMLGELDFTVLGEAGDGFDAIELCRARRPDVVLMDVKMPVFDGLSAAETIVADDLAECVVMLTAFGQRDVVERANSIGVTGYLVKPIEQRMLLPTIEVALAQSRRLRQSRREAERARRQVEESKLIARAQGLLAREMGVSETQAYQELRRMAMDKRTTIAALAAAVVERRARRQEVDEAKALLQRRRRMSESSAYQYVVRESQRRSCSLEEAARRIVAELRE